MILLAFDYIKLFRLMVITDNNKRHGKMIGIKRKYATRVHNYSIAMNYYEKLLNK